MSIIYRRLSKRETPWFFSTDLHSPETDDDGYVFDTGYLVAHGFGFHFGIYWSRK